MFARLRRLLIGSPLPSWRAVHERLPKILALPIFSSDALSSVAYATEEILLVLVLAGTVVLKSPLVIWISTAIVVLLAIVVTSYRQTIYAYPSGGGAYIVAKENLGDKYGLIAGSALTIDYTLTVAVSIAAGVSAIISAYPSLAEHRVALALCGILILTLGNLRGVRESGLLFAFPTYFFIASMAGLIGFSFFRLLTGQEPAAPTSHIVREPVHALTLFLILRAFSGGCSAMTGTEAISNAVPAFRQPESRNAAITLTIMGFILATIFLSLSFLAYKIGVVPLETDQPGYQTVVSQIARATFEDTRFRWYYYVIQWATAIILILAANTSFAGFPRLASIMARDRYMPRQLYNLGDRLVFSNGIIVLATLASLLIIVFKGDTHALIPLYAIGVFLSFTLSQWGMAVRFSRLKEPGWRRKSFVSAFGAACTAVVVVVQAVTKFLDGAYVVIILIVGFTWIFSKIHSHYIQVGEQLRLRPEDKIVPAHNTVLVLTPSLHRGILPALAYAKGLSDDVRAVHIETDPLDTILLEERWERWGGGIPLVILESPYRSLVAPLLEYLNEVKQEHPNNIVTVIIPEFVPAKWWHKLLHNQSGLLLKFVLLFERGVVTVNVRYYLER